MNNRFGLANAENIDNRLPKFRSRIKLYFILAALAMLCTYAVAQEDTAGYWLKKGDGLRNEFLMEFAMLNNTILQPGTENVSVWIDKNKESIESYKKALEITNRTLEGNPQNADAWKDRGVALASLGRESDANESYEKAIEIYDQIIEKNPKNNSALLSKADAFEVLGRSEAALEAYDKVIALNSTNDPGALIRKSDILFELGKYNMSAETFDKVVDLLANDTGKMAVEAGLEPADNQFATIQGGNLVKKITCSMKGNHTDANKVVWKEKEGVISINTWIYKGQVLRVLFNRYNESSKSYDIYMQIDSNFVDYWRNKELSVKSRLINYQKVFKAYGWSLKIANKSMDVMPLEISI